MKITFFVGLLATLILVIGTNILCETVFKDSTNQMACTTCRCAHDAKRVFGDILSEIRDQAINLNYGLQE